MTHRARILKMLASLPTRGRQPQSCARTVLEGMARTPQDRHAAAALIDYMLALGELVPYGGPRNRTFGLPRRAR